MNHYDAIVLGAGGVGSAVMLHLARRGARVLGIDRFHPPHDRGSSHGHTRVIRQAYFEHPDYVPLLVESYRLWRELEQQVGRHLFHQVGLIQAGPPEGHVVPGALRSAAQHNLAVEQLSANEIEKRWPGLRAAHHLIGAYEPGAGYLLVEDCVRAHLDAARAAGAEFLGETEVEAWSASGDEVRVKTARGEFTANRLVITAGAWAGRNLLPLPMGEGRGEGAQSPKSPNPNPLPKGEGTIKLTVRRKSLFWFEAAAAEYEVANGFPVFLFELPHGVFYGFPKLDARGVKVAEHSGGRTVNDPLVVDRSIDRDERERLIQFLSAHLPGVSNKVMDHAVCLYTMSPDENFIVDRHPAHSNVVFAAGLSGHGFKFVPVLGRALAELALDGGTKLPIGFLSLGRLV
ncbi:MAG TPA: N-methyl-L-tryptophan oxidase [Lacipirellulaceae bacterium]|nr:N-methyl-L-tryptophan oxidase [Lacipirellulaceae bacterium]